MLRSKQALAEAVALVAQRNSDLAFTRTDFERGKTLLEHGNIPQQTVDLRRNKFEAADAAHAAALAQRDEAEFAIKAAEADVERLQAILVVWCSSLPGADGCNTGSPAPVKWLRLASAF